MSESRELPQSSTACCDDTCCSSSATDSELRASASTNAALIVTLREARSADLGQVLQLLSEAALPVSGVEELFENAFAVVESRGEVVAAAGVEVHGQYGLLRSVVVSPDYRSLGLGAALTKNRVEWAEEHGIEALYLLTTTAGDFFARNGFTRVTRDEAPPEIWITEEFASACPASAELMTLVLRPREKEPADVEAKRIRAVVRDKYGQAAVRAAGGRQASCGTACCGDGEAGRDPITSDLYQASELSGLPAEAVLASLGCGNPTALADLKTGETVLDLGSGGGIDVLLSAKRVGPTGKAYGLDMTDEMLALARDNQRKAGVTNVEFLRGEIENVPLPDNSVDVIISNCVINLSADKQRVLTEAHRVLRPGGRLAVSDVVVRGKMPPELRQEMELWAGCVAGALEDSEYLRLLSAAGFADIKIEPTRVHGADELACLPGAERLKNDSSAIDAVDGKLMSAFIRARKQLTSERHEPIEPAV